MEAKEEVEANSLCEEYCLPRCRVFGIKMEIILVFLVALHYHAIVWTWGFKEENIRQQQRIEKIRTKNDFKNCEKGVWKKK